MFLKSICHSNIATIKTSEIDFDSSYMNQQNWHIVESGVTMSLYAVPYEEIVIVLEEYNWLCWKVLSNSFGIVYIHSKTFEGTFGDIDKKENWLKL